MHELASFFFNHWFWHPLVNGPGYNFWSGIAGSFLTVLPGWFAAAFIFARHSNCHTPWCLRVGRFPLEGTPYRVCKKHHPDVPDKLTLAHMHKTYYDNKISGE